MKKQKILLCGLPSFYHNYGAQGLTLPLISELNKKNPAEYLVTCYPRYFNQENLKFAKQNGFTLISEPNVLTILKNYSFIYKILFTLRSLILKLSGKNHVLLKEDKEAKAFVQVLSGCKAFIDVDGIEFVGTRPFIKKLQNFMSMVYFQEIANELDIPYLKNTKSYGPFLGFWDCYLAKKHFSKLPYVLVRAGGDNLKAVKTLKINQPIYEFPDISFALEPSPVSWASNYIKKTGLNLKKPIVGISCSSVIYSLQQKQKIEPLELYFKLIDYFQKQDKQILLLPHHVIGGHNPNTCDLALSRLVYKKLQSKKQVYLLDSSVLTYAQVRAIIGMFDFYITGRFHSLVSSLIMEVPVISLSWHMKYRDLFSLFLKKYPLIDTSRTKSEDAYKIIKQFESDRSWFNKLILRKNKQKYLQSIAKNIDLLVSKVK
jgi:polysaccharide pyruvyl transferase WcaK-like protein